MNLPLTRKQASLASDLSPPGRGAWRGTPLEELGDAAREPARSGDAAIVDREASEAANDQATRR